MDSLEKEESRLFSGFFCLQGFWSKPPPASLQLSAIGDVGSQRQGARAAGPTHQQPSLPQQMLQEAEQICSLHPSLLATPSGIFLPQQEG